MRRVLEHVEQVARTRAPLLVEGEPGSGRHRVAQAIHRGGPRANAPFVRVRCTALGEPGAEHALFGEAGESNLFAAAAGGTLYLEEVADLPPATQARLLLALHEAGLGPRDGAGRSLDVRVIASTAQDLGAAVARGAFRSDLYDRLAVVRIRVPALRERPEDLAALVAELLAERRGDRGRPRGITPGALERLAAHAWPGNVAELRDVLAEMLEARRGRGPLSVSDLPERVRATAPARVEVVVGMTVREVERRLVAATLERTGADKRRAAALLGIGLRTLYRKIREYGLG